MKRGGEFPWYALVGIAALPQVMLYCPSACRTAAWAETAREVAEVPGLSQAVDALRDWRVDDLIPGICLLFMVQLILVLLLVLNIRHRRNAEASLRRSEEALRYREAFQNIIAGILTELINVQPADSERAFNRALGMTGEFTGTDRAQLYFFCEGGARADNTHEWCAEGIESHRDRLQDLRVERFPFFSEPIKRSETVLVPRLADLPPEAESEKEALELEGIQSLLLVPIKLGHIVVGFLRLDSVRKERSWTPDTVALLRIVGEILANVFDRRRADEALRQEKRFTDTLVDSMPGIFYVFDEGGRLTRWNNRLERSFGYGAEEIGHMSVLDLFVPEDRSLIAETIQKTFAGEESHAEGRFLTQDGAAIPFFLTGVRMTINHGSYIVGVGVDIRERVRAEAESRRLQALLRSVIVQSPIPMVLALPDGTVELFNESCRSVLGIGNEIASRSELNLFTLEPGWEDYSAEGARVPFSELPLMLALKGMTTRSREMKVLRQDGSERWILVDAVPVYDSQGEVIAGFLIFPDITDRKRMEQSLYREREFIRALLENMVDSVVACDAEGKLALLNRTAREWHGLDPVHIPQTEWADYYGLYQEDGVTPMTAATIPLARAFRGERLRDAAMVIRARGQLPRYVTSHCAPFFDTDGRLLGAVAVMRDLTEARRMELALRESEERFRQIVESSPMPICIADASGRGEYVNPSFREILGYTLNEVPDLDQWLFRAFPDEDYREVIRNRWERLLEAAAREHRPSEIMDARITCRDGTVRVMQVFGAIMGDRVLAVFNDLTERARSEAALRESEERFTVFMENLPAGAFMKDVPGQVVYANRYLIELFGWGDVVGQATGDLLPPELAAKMEADDRAALAHGPMTLVEQVRDVADRERVFQTIKFPIARQDRSPLLGGIAVDITELKQAEEALRSSIAEKELLLKEVHHRVKNNLQVISSLLSLQFRKVKSSEVRSFLRDTQNRIRSMAMLHEILYRSENIAHVSLPLYVKSLCDHVARSYDSAARNIRLRHRMIDVTLNLDQAITAGLIINELVSNALKHAFPSRAEGEILVELERADEQHLSLRISDNGIGLPAETDPLGTDTLGLLLVRTLCRQLGARMSVAGGEWTVFEMVFPAHPL